MMTMTLSIDIKEYFKIQKEIIKDMIETFGNPPTLAVIQVGDLEASNRYIKNKKKDCEEVGIKFEWYHYPETITTEELVSEIKDLCPYVDALLVQFPLPDHIDTTAIKLSIILVLITGSTSEATINNLSRFAKGGLTSSFFLSKITEKGI